MSGTRSERGGTSVEYGLIAFLVAATLAVAVGFMADANRASFEDSCEQLSSAMARTC